MAINFFNDTQLLLKTRGLASLCRLIAQILEQASVLSSVNAIVFDVHGQYTFIR